MKVTRNFDRIYETKKRVVLNRGGSSSSKTYSIMQLFFKWLTTGEFREDEYFFKGVGSIVRQYRSQIEGSVLRDWKNIVDEEGYVFSNRYAGGNVIKENKATLTYEYQGRILEFIGLDDQSKAKGPRRKILYINEADQVKKKVAMQLLMRTEGPCLFDWNPDDDEVWLNEDIEQKRAQEIGDVELIVSTFRDNAFLSDSIVKEILALKILDPDEWEVYGNGGYGKIKGVIFKEGVHWNIGELPEGARLLGYGQDYGFTTDPTTLLGVYKGPDGSIYLDEVIYELNLINTYIDESQMQSSIQGHYEINGVQKNYKIWADSSEQKSNEELHGTGYNVEGVTKGPGSVVAGLKFMKKYKIFITPRSLETIREFKKYIWATDKNGKTLKDKEGRPIPKDKNNHCIDAGRYGMTHLLSGPDMSKLSLTIG